MKQRAVIRVVTGVAAAAGAGVVIAVLAPVWHGAADALVGEDEAQLDTEPVAPPDAGLDGGADGDAGAADAQTGPQDR